MAKDRRPPDLDRITDLRRYKRAREAQARNQARDQARRDRRPAGSREPLLGANPRARLILGLLVLVMLAMWLGPSLLARLT